MTKLETAFQEYDVNTTEYESQFRFKKPIYIARHNPYMLARAIMDSGRQVLLKHGHQPSTVLVDLPCTLFMIDNRNMSVVEDMARLLTFSPKMTVCCACSAADCLYMRFEIACNRSARFHCRYKSMG